MLGVPEYFDFLGSLLTTAMVNCEKWLQPVARIAWFVPALYLLEPCSCLTAESGSGFSCTWKEFIIVGNAEE